MKASVLIVRDAGTWWLSIPNAGIFMKNLIRGRKAAITIIKKTKYREIFKDVSVVQRNCLLAFLLKREINFLFSRRWVIK